MGSNATITSAEISRSNFAANNNSKFTTHKHTLIDPNDADKFVLDTIMTSQDNGEFINKESILSHGETASISNF